MKLNPIIFQVREVRQTSGGGDYIVSYTASVELRADNADVNVAVDSCVPEDAEQKLVAMAAASIRDGFLNVLEPLRTGASVHVTRLAIHEVDFKPKKFELHTAEHFRRALERESRASRE